MKKIIKNIIMQGSISIVIAGISYLVSGSIVIAVIFLLILLLLVMIKPALMLLNKLIQRTNWYKNHVGDGLKFIKQFQCNLDICNLGSNSGKYAFEYEGTGLEGENWALGPQTLSYDFRILKNYFSYLKEGATVLIPICPFSSCIKDFEDDLNNHKYYSFLHPILIVNYSQRTQEKVMRFVNTPFQVSPIKALVRLIKDVPIVDNIINDKENLESDAEKFVNNWIQQFSIYDLDAAVSEPNKENITYNTNLLTEMITFCIDRNLKPVIIIPPITIALSSKLPETFRNNYIYSFIKKAITKQVSFLNYIDDERFLQPDLYFNSYFLNQKGRTLFTKIVLQDLQLN